jgi:hypothetical protein
MSEHDDLEAGLTPHPVCYANELGQTRLQRDAIHKVRREVVCRVSPDFIRGG